MTPPRETRSLERLQHHDVVESELASRLRSTRDRDTRRGRFAAIYAELFARVPDHPRLTGQKDPTAGRVQAKRLLHLLRPYLHPSAEFLEFGAGACALAFAVAPHVRHVRAVDIADRIPDGAVRPRNFELVLYDGYDLDVPDESIDLAFSEQFVETLHPDDGPPHFALAWRVLRPGGRYMLRTSQRWTGPHDISRWFSDAPQGLHLKEWTYGELAATGRAAGFRRCIALWSASGRAVRWPLAVAGAAEAALARLPRGTLQRFGAKLVPMVTVVLEK